LGAAAKVRDPEVAALTTEASGVGVIGDVPLDAVGAVEADGVFFAVGGADEEAIAIGPLGGDEGAAFELLKRFCGVEQAGEQQDKEGEDFHT
jgi:hypothetical protein